MKEIREKYDRLVKSLIEKKLTITTMESCTGGQIASLITDNEGSSECLKGSFVTYSNEAKISCGVPECTIESFGVYSKETAQAMADASRRFFDADIGVGITGTFSNVDEKNPDSVPGSVWCAISSDKRNEAFHIDIPQQDDRSKYKLYVADQLIERLEAVHRLFTK